MSTAPLTPLALLTSLAVLAPSHVCLLPAQDWGSAAAGPTARQLPRLAYDAARSRVVLFGGYARNGSASLGDTWTYDGAAWAQQSPAASPSKRDSHAMSYDSLRGVVTLFGGVDTPTFPASITGDTWEWNGTTWTQLTPAAAPGPRFGAAMAFDQARGVQVLFAGSSSSAALADTWEWNGTTWTQRQPAVSPPARANHALAYDVRRSRIVLFGGVQGATALADTWEYDGTTWTQVTTTPAPSARRGNGLAYDLLRGVTVLYGGLASSLLGDTWEFDGTYWHRYRGITAPGNRTNTAMTYDLTRLRVVMFGGAGGSDFGDCWELLHNRASLTLYGSGCAGTAGTAALDGSSLPLLGNTLQMTLGQVPASAPTVLLLSAVGATSFAIPGTACTLRVLPPAVDIAATAAGGTSAFPLAVPSNPALAGLTLFLQGAALDPAANPLGIVASNGARAVVY